MASTISFSSSSSLIFPPDPIHEENYPTRGAVLASSIISLICCVCVIVLSIVYNKIKKVCWRSILYCCIINLDLILCYAFWDKIGENNTALCNVFGFTLTVTSLITNCWLLFIAVVMFNLVVKKSNELIVSKRMEICWFVFFLVLSIICGLLPMKGINAFGLRYAKVHPGWCHIKNENPEDNWGPLYLYVIQWIFIGLIILIYIYVYVFANLLIRKQRQKIMLTHADRNMRRRIFTLFKQIWIFPLIMIVSWIPTTVCRIVKAVRKGDDDNGASEWVTAIVVPIMGLFLFICFMLTSYVPKDIMHSITKLRKNRQKKKLKSIVGTEDDDYEEYNDEEYDGMGSERLLSDGLNSQDILK